MDLFDTVVRYEVALWSAMDRALRQADEVALDKLGALRVIARHDGRARVQEISDEIGITVGAASKVVDRLELAGLVERRANPANRRSSLVDLTSAGRESVRSATALYERTLAELVGEEDVEPVIAALKRLRDRIDRLQGGAAS